MVIYFNIHKATIIKEKTNAFLIKTSPLNAWVPKAAMVVENDKIYVRLWIIQQKGFQRIHRKLFMTPPDYTDEMIAEKIPAVEYIRK